MLVGVPKEIKQHEYRVGLVPASIRELVSRNHQVLVEHNAGVGIGISDDEFIAAGASIAASSADIFADAELIVKVKEPQPAECRALSAGQTLFTYLHLAADHEQTRLLKNSGCCAIAYETVTQDGGGLPLLTPMSQVAGRMSIQAGAHCLEKAQAGRGILLGGVPGVAPANVVVIGGGVVGTNAIRMAMGMEAHVTVIDKSLERLRQLDFQFGAKLNTIFATKDSIEEYVASADLLVGAVLIPGAVAPKLITRAMLATMRKAAVIVDVAIDQGGCCETSRPTTHDDPTYITDDIVHYCVANMPGAVPHTSTFALNNATLPFVIRLCDQDIEPALLNNQHLLNGLNIYKGQLTCEAVAQALGEDFVPAKEALL